jgi:hypothetical protein
MMPTDQPSGSIHTLHIDLPSINIAIPAGPANKPEARHHVTHPCFCPTLVAALFGTNEPIVTGPVIKDLLKRVIFQSG